MYDSVKDALGEATTDEIWAELSRRYSCAVLGLLSQTNEGEARDYRYSGGLTTALGLTSVMLGRLHEVPDIESEYDDS